MKFLIGKQFNYLLMYFTTISFAMFSLEYCLAQSPGEIHQSPGQTNSTSPDSAESDTIWNSKEMLEARAYLETYFERSAKISPEQAAKYMADLKAMSPDQLQVWLIKFQEEREQSKQAYDRGRQMRNKAALGELPAQQVGGFQNPYAGKAAVSSGLPAGTFANASGGNRNTFAPAPQVQKPFSSPNYERSVRPLVTSQDAARYEILRGLAPFPLY